MSLSSVIRFVIAWACLALATPAPCEVAPGMLFRNPATLAAGDLDELINLVGDGIRLDSYVKHGGDFEAFSRTLAVDGRAGKVFEAVVAHEANLKLPVGRRLLATAAEGYKADAADLAMARRTADGYVVEELYQLKWGWEAVSALDDPLYDGMTIITTQETYDEAVEEVRRKSLTKASLGRELSPKTARLKDALESGRIPAKLPGGAPLPTRDEVRVISRLRDVALWDGLAQAPAVPAQGIVRGGLASQAAESMVASAGARLIAAKSSGEALQGAVVVAEETGPVTAGAYRQVARVAGVALLRLAQTTLVIDAAYASWLVATDFGRWQDGAVTVDEFMALSALRALRIGLSVGALVDPELFSKATFIAAFIVVSGLEYACEKVCAGRQEELRVALMSLETEERYLMTRQLVLGN